MGGAGHVGADEVPEQTSAGSAGAGDVNAVLTIAGYQVALDRVVPGLEEDARKQVPVRGIARHVRPDEVAENAGLSSTIDLDSGRVVLLLKLRLEIARRVDELGREIAQALPRDFVAVGLLKGSFMFVADLVRALHAAGAAPEVEFMRLSSYGPRKVSAGEVHLLGDIPTDIEGRAVLRGCVLLQDVRRDPGEDETLLIEWLRERGVPVRVAITKTDKLKRGARARRSAEIRARLDLPGDAVLETSAESGAGVDALWREIDRLVTEAA